MFPLNQKQQKFPFDKFIRFNRKGKFYSFSEAPDDGFLFTASKGIKAATLIEGGYSANKLIEGR